MICVHQSGFQNKWGCLRIWCLNAEAFTQQWIDSGRNDDDDIMFLVISLRDIVVIIVT